MALVQGNRGVTALVVDVQSAGRWPLRDGPDDSEGAGDAHGGEVECRQQDSHGEPDGRLLDGVVAEVDAGHADEQCTHE